MTDPYKVLGISPSATDDQVKAAYRELARKYHPDVHAGSDLADLAAEKMKEVNEAYDTIMSQRRNGGGRSYSGSQYPDIRRMVQQERYYEAEELLNGIPQDRRDAEWYFLRGSVYYGRGWLDEAARNFRQAANMNPSNPEYRAALNRMMYQQSGGMHSGGQPYRTTQTGSCSACDICQGLICADCCCEMCGGNLIPCCGCR